MVNEKTDKSSIDDVIGKMFGEVGTLALQIENMGNKAPKAAYGLLAASLLRMSERAYGSHDYASAQLGVEMAKHYAGKSGVAQMPKYIGGAWDAYVKKADAQHAKDQKDK